VIPHPKDDPEAFAKAKGLIDERKAKAKQETA